MAPQSLTKTPRFGTRALAVGGIGPLDITLAAGGRATLAGPSEAGKTRLLRAMADLDAHAGECRLDGAAADTFSGPAWRRRVTFVPAQSAWWHDQGRPHLFGSATVTATRAAALGLAETVLDQPIGQLSAGQCQRAALLRALSASPAVLLLDEPTGSLDADNAARVEALIAAYCCERGACCVWVSHDAAQRARVGDRHIELDPRGRVVRCS